MCQLALKGREGWGGGPGSSARSTSEREESDRDPCDETERSEEHGAEDRHGDGEREEPADSADHVQVAVGWS